MSDQYMGEIRLAGFSYAPSDMGWLPCDGRLLNIAEYDVLFSLLGTMFGGDGHTTFGLPDLRGCVPIGRGQLNGLSANPNFAFSQRIGMTPETPQFVGALQLTASTMPSHTHTFQPPCNTTDSSSNDPANSVPGNVGSGLYDSTSNALMASSQTGSAGSSSPAATFTASTQLPMFPLQPSTGINYIIAVQGIFPQRP